MSPEDKLKRAAIFKKMALRDKLEASRKRQSLGVLRDELSKNQGVRDQLENLVEEASSPDEAKTAMALYSASWYNTRVRDQLEMVANRCTHLDKEVQTMQNELARAEQKRAKKQERDASIIGTHSKEPKYRNYCSHTHSAVRRQ